LASTKFGIWDLARLTLWGMAAAAALTVVAYAGSTDVARGRVKIAVADIRETWSPATAKKPRMLSADEGRRLAETVHALSADRERLLTRIAALEHDVEDITSSIVRVQKAQRDSEKPRAKEPAFAPQPEAVAPPAAPAQDVTSSISAPSAASQIPMPPRPTKPEYGLDLGGAPSVEALRNAWTIAVRKHSKLLEGLEPAIHTRERPRGGGPELRLVAGPLPNAATAARLCAAMTAAGAICAPSVYDGQRLALP
jgi:hypothetical protein